MLIIVNHYVRIFRLFSLSQVHIYSLKSKSELHLQKKTKSSSIFIQKALFVFKYQCQGECVCLLIFTIKPQQLQTLASSWPCQFIL